MQQWHGMRCKTIITITLQITPEITPEITPNLPCNLFCRHSHTTLRTPLTPIRIPKDAPPLPSSGKWHCARFVFR